MGAKHPKYIVYMYEIVKEFFKTNNNPPTKVPRRSGGPRCGRWEGKEAVVW